MTPEERVLATLVRRGLATVAAQAEADTWRLVQPPVDRPLPLATAFAPFRLRIDWAKMELDAAEQAVAVARRRRRAG